MLGILRSIKQGLLDNHSDKPWHSTNSRATVNISDYSIAEPSGSFGCICIHYGVNKEIWLAEIHVPLHAVALCCASLRLRLTIRTHSNQVSPSNQVSASLPSTVLLIQSITSSTPDGSARQRLRCHCLCVDPHLPG